MAAWIAAAAAASAAGAYQRSLIRTMARTIRRHIGEDMGIEPYPGTAVPSEEHLGDYYGAGQYYDPYYKGAMGVGEDPLYGRAGEALERGLSGEAAWDTDPEAAEQYWRDKYYEPAMTRFRQDILPQLREDYAGAGGYQSGGRRRAETRAAGRVAVETSGQLGDILWRERESGRLAKERALERALSTARYVPDYLGVPLGYARDVGGIKTGLARDIGMMKSGFERERLGEAQEKWLAKQPWASPYMSLGMQAVGVGATQPYLYQSKMPWYGHLGQAMAGAGSTGLGYGLGQRIAAGG